jgi:hydroxyquinol 1,2-dioxygenase
MDLTEDTVAEMVRAETGATPDTRLGEVMEALVRHLRAFAREVRLTQGEWLEATRFLTGIARHCDVTRPELNLLSDALGLSALASLMEDATAGPHGAVESLLGAFFGEAMPVLPAGASIAAEPRGEPIVLHGRVLDARGKPVAGATLDIWQTNEDGLYGAEPAADGTLPADMRGRFQTDAEGRYMARTVLPRRGSIKTQKPEDGLVRAGGWRAICPVHIQMLVIAPGHPGLITALCIADDGPIDSDTVFGANDPPRLIPGQPDASLPFASLRQIRHDLRLSADGSAPAGTDPASLERRARTRRPRDRRDQRPGRTE